MTRSQALERRLKFDGPYGFFFPSGSVVDSNNAMYSFKGQEFGDSYLLFTATLNVGDSSGRFFESYFASNPVHPEYASMNVFFDVTNIAVAPAVPEPSTWAMLLIGFAGIAAAGFRKRRTYLQV
jgi:PEP-CTERM motif